LDFRVVRDPFERSRKVTLENQKSKIKNQKSKIKDHQLANIVIYQKPTCTTCRQVYAALKDSGVDFDAVDYYTDPIPKAKLKELLRKMGISPRDLLRTREQIYKKLELAKREVSDEDLLDLMVEHPDLIQRPIVEKGSRAILARPAERLKDIL
jgi:arsenate reductase